MRFFKKVAAKRLKNIKNWPKVEVKPQNSVKIWSEWQGSNLRHRHPKYIIEHFLCHFKQFIALSSGNHLLCKPLVSTVSMCSENDCGMRCGRKNTPRTRNLLGEFAVGGMLTLNRQKVKSFLPPKFEPQ